MASPASPPEWTLTARWIVPVAQPPLEQGTVTICGERIVAVQGQGQRKADLDLGRAAILPGLVNAHTHLDLSGLAAPGPSTRDFTSWLREVIRHRRSTTLFQGLLDVNQGLSECLKFGTTLVGDISSQGQTVPVLGRRPIWGVVFLELLGLTSERAGQEWLNAVQWLGAPSLTDTCRWGLSPHAPYSVRRSLFQNVAHYAARCHREGSPLPVAVHLAETREELELLQHHRGPLVPFLEELGAWDPSGLVDAPSTLMELFREVPRVLWIHGNFLDPDVPLGPDHTLVYCPRTHAAFGHPPHPFREFLKRGVRIALGTDSLASNPDLDILAEARFLHRQYPEVPGADLLRMITLNGAQALGWDAAVGSLDPGKSADLGVLPLPRRGLDNPCRVILESTAAIGKLLYRGQWVSP